MSGKMPGGGKKERRYPVEQAQELGQRTDNGNPRSGRMSRAVLEAAGKLFAKYATETLANGNGWAKQGVGELPGGDRKLLQGMRPDQRLRMQL
jgi:hypothetical protein